LISTHSFRNLVLAFCLAVTAHAQTSGEKVPGRFILELRPGASVPSVVSPIKVVNMSLVGPGALGYNSSYGNAVRRLRDLGITGVVAAGNDPSQEVSAVVPATYLEAFAVASISARTGKDDIGWFIGSDNASFLTTDGASYCAMGIGVKISAPGEDQEDIVSGNIQNVGILSTRLGGGTTQP
jgi:hypothetical protein